MSKSTPLFVGLDVHEDSIVVAHAQGQSAEPPVFVGAIGTRQADLDKLIRRLQAKTSTLVFALVFATIGAASASARTARCAYTL